MGLKFERKAGSRGVGGNTMTDTDRLEQIKARLAKAKVAQVSVKLGVFAHRDAPEGDHVKDYCDWFNHALSDMDDLLAQLEQAEKDLAAAKPYQEFVEWALKQPPAQGSGKLCPRMGNQTCPWANSPEGFCAAECIAISGAWHAWQERKGK